MDLSEDITFLQMHQSNNDCLLITKKKYLKWHGFRSDYNAVDKGICFSITTFEDNTQSYKWKYIRLRDQLICSPLSVVPGVLVGKL